MSTESPSLNAHEVSRGLLRVREEDGVVLDRQLRDVGAEHLTAEYDVIGELHSARGIGAADAADGHGHAGRVPVSVHDHIGIDDDVRGSDDGARKT
jgi:hypothetical protein